MTRKSHVRPDRVKVKQQDGNTRRWQVYALMILCGLLFVSGFFLAGRQHFSSMDFGMKNSRLRRQVDELEAEKRRLLLTREFSLSPTEIKKAAKKAGFADQAAVNAWVNQIAAVVKGSAVPQPAVQAKPMIIKTAAVATVKQSRPEVIAKTTRFSGQVKKTEAAE